LVKDSTAPAFIACTEAGISPWPVRNTMGSPARPRPSRARSAPAVAGPRPDTLAPRRRDGPGIPVRTQMFQLSIRRQRIVLYRRALQSLTREERLVCIWKKARFSNGEIARQLGTSEPVVQELFFQAELKMHRIVAANSCCRDRISAAPGRGSIHVCAVSRWKVGARAGIASSMPSERRASPRAFPA
jgi:hypothetical protein